MQTKIILIPLFRRLPVSTDGTATPVYYDLKQDVFKGILPYAVSLTLHSLRARPKIIVSEGRFNA